MEIDSKPFPNFSYRICPNWYFPSCLNSMICWKDRFEILIFLSWNNGLSFFIFLRFSSRENFSLPDFKDWNLRKILLKYNSEVSEDLKLPESCMNPGVQVVSLNVIFLFPSIPNLWKILGERTEGLVREGDKRCKLSFFTDTYCSLPEKDDISLVSSTLSRLCVTTE